MGVVSSGAMRLECLDDNSDALCLETSVLALIFDCLQDLSDCLISPIREHYKRRVLVIVYFFLRDETFRVEPVEFLQ